PVIRSGCGECQSIECQPPFGAARRAARELDPGAARGAGGIDILKYRTIGVMGNHDGPCPAALEA
ncbi:unnamed protein product, partial [Symbiodinium sp. CCMP2456]